tara:strand:+ start:3420 stop:3854 length:435 start_codon:yes stop_codon:yes gene_type:complete
MELTKEKTQRIASGLTLPTQTFIDGRFFDTPDGDTFETINQVNCGQNCSVNMRQIIDAKIADSFLDTGYGLHATVFTKDIDRVFHLARLPSCGTVVVNRFSEGDIKTPLGGYKRSGSLSHNNGTETMVQYFQTKIISIFTGGPA